MRIDCVKKDVADFLGIQAEKVVFDIPLSNQEGDFCISVFKQAKERNKESAELATDLANFLKSIEGIGGAPATSGHVNGMFDYEAFLS